MYGGAAGGGKSAATVMEAFKLCIKNPGIQCYLFRRTYPELEQSLILEAYKRLSGIGKYSSTAHEWKFSNGSKILFRHCQHEKDRFLYQGAEIHALFIDELTHFTQQQFDYLKTRVRAEAKLKFKPRTRCTSNPGGVGHAWVKQRYADLEPFVIHQIKVKSEALNKERIVTRQYIPARVTDNPHISESYIFELEQKPPELRKALLEGSWDVFEGQVFFEWRDDPEHYADGKRTHVINPFEIPRGWPRYRSFDWGFEKPFSVQWWTVDQNDRVYLYREWYGAKGPDIGIRMSTPQIARGIKEREQNDGEIFGYADPSIWDESRGESIAAQLAENGVYFNPGDNTRLAGKMQLHNRLVFDESGIPMLYVFSTCREFIRTIPALVYSETRVEDVDTKTEDHIYDSTRYFLMSRPMGVKPRPEKDPDYPDYDDQVDNFLDYGR